MRTDRRRVLFSLAGAFTSLGIIGTAQGDQRPSDALPAGIGTRPDYVGPVPRANLGGHPAYPSETATAAQIISRAPPGPQPYEVAKYFLAVANGVYGPTLQPYTYGWPQRWNPLIVDFFQATSTQPEGDLTPWCAAFTNWCFLHASGRPATQSASSGSFRCFGVATASPSEGDIVVFKRSGDLAACTGTGHVGFFVRDLGNAVAVLGGNQIDGHTGSHKISQKPILKSGDLLTLHSYRKVEP